MKKAKIGDKFQVRYTGNLSDDTFFDTNKDKDPLEFVLVKEN